MHGYSKAKQQLSPQWSDGLQAELGDSGGIARSQLGEVWKCAATQRQDEHRVLLSLRFILITPVCRDLKDS